jgi:hypothetical protein
LLYLLCSLLKYAKSAWSKVWLMVDLCGFFYILTFGSFSHFWYNLAALSLEHTTYDYINSGRSYLWSCTLCKIDHDFVWIIVICSLFAIHCSLLKCSKIACSQVRTSTNCIANKAKITIIQKHHVYFDGCAE